MISLPPASFSFSFSFSLALRLFFTAHYSLCINAPYVIDTISSLYFSNAIYKYKKQTDWVYLHYTGYYYYYKLIEKAKNKLKLIIKPIYFRPYCVL